MPSEPASTVSFLHPFVRQLVAKAGLTLVERDILAASGVSAAEDVQSLLMAFPSLRALGLRLPLVSNAVVRDIGAAFAASAQDVAETQPIASLGAAPPEGAQFVLGSIVDMATATAAVAAGPPALAPAGTINLLPPGAWPVRYQGQRGTCVAHGTTACVEISVFAAEGPNPDYSEQFLYWAIKTKTSDPNPNTDGTWLRFAGAALQSHGICHEARWPYVQTRVNPISGATAADPSAAAISDAAAHRMTPGTYNGSPTGAAATVLQLLAAGRPVAICLPVFGDPAVPNGPTNWSTNVGWAYGRVINPPPTSVVVGGHCVCVMGFAPDAAEPHGGYFIIRNSWDTAWGHLAPAAGYNSPAPGYGDLSASYVDAYCWELMQL